jgi:hypothetical protein
MSSMKVNGAIEIDARPIGRIRVWDGSGFLILQRRIENCDRFPDVEHAAVADARALWPGNPRHVTVEIGDKRTVHVVDGPFLRDPMEFVAAMTWPTNSLLDSNESR